MKKKKLQCSVPTFLLAGVLCLTLADCGLALATDSAASAALPVKAMNAKRVDENPYMAKSDANIHHDGYNTDSTDEVLPLGIYPSAKGHAGKNPPGMHNIQDFTQIRLPRIPALNQGGTVHIVNRHVKGFHGCICGDSISLKRRASLRL